jgi:hypothetical protein
MGVNLFMVLTQIFATIDTAIPFTSDALHTDVTQRGRMVERPQIFFVDTYSVQQNTKVGCALTSGVVEILSSI